LLRHSRTRARRGVVDRSIARRGVNPPPPPPPPQPPAPPPGTPPPPPAVRGRCADSPCGTSQPQPSARTPPSSSFTPRSPQQKFEDALRRRRTSSGRLRRRGGKGGGCAAGGLEEEMEAAERPSSATATPPPRWASSRVALAYFDEGGGINLISNKSPPSPAAFWSHKRLSRA
jgi:hypothetical protein